MVALGITDTTTPEEIVAAVYVGIGAELASILAEMRRHGAAIDA
jgi:hypothetical protein